MCVTNHHDMTLAVKVELNPYLLNQFSISWTNSIFFIIFNRTSAYEFSQCKLQNFVSR